MEPKKLRALKTIEHTVDQGRWQMITFFCSGHRLMTTYMVSTSPTGEPYCTSHSDYETMLFAGGPWVDLYVDYHDTQDQARAAHMAKVEDLETRAQIVDLVEESDWDLDRTTTFRVGEVGANHVSAGFMSNQCWLELEVVDPEDGRASFWFDADNAAELEDLANWLLEGARRLRAGKDT